MKPGHGSAPEGMVFEEKVFQTKGVLGDERLLEKNTRENEQILYRSIPLMNG